MSFERLFQNQIPLHEAAAFFMKLKYAEAGTMPASSAPAQDPSAAGMPDVHQVMAEVARLKLQLATTYRVYSESLRDPANTALSEHFKEHAENELEHADYFIRRLSVLQGSAELGALEPPPSATDLTTILSTIMEGEKNVIAALQELHQLVGENPMKYEIEAMMVLDQHHYDDMMQHMPAGLEQDPGDQAAAAQPKTAEERSNARRIGSAALKGAVGGSVIPVGLMLADGKLSEMGLLGAGAGLGALTGATLQGAEILAEKAHEKRAANHDDVPTRYSKASLIGGAGGAAAGAYMFRREYGTPYFPIGVAIGATAGSAAGAAFEGGRDLIGSLRNKKPYPQFKGPSGATEGALGKKNSDFIRGHAQNAVEGTAPAPKGPEKDLPIGNPELQKNAFAVRFRKVARALKDEEIREEADVMPSVGSTARWGLSMPFASMGANAGAAIGGVETPYPALAGLAAGLTGAQLLGSHLDKHKVEHNEKMLRHALASGMDPEELARHTRASTNVSYALFPLANVVNGANPFVGVPVGLMAGAKNSQRNQAFVDAYKRLHSKSKEQEQPKEAGLELDPETTAYLQQEQEAHAATEDNAMGYYRTRFSDALTQLQQAQEQMTAQQEQIQQLQTELEQQKQQGQALMEQSQQTNDMATQTAQQAHAVASEAVQTNLQTNQELIQQMALSANMRNAIDQMKQQMMQVAMQPSPPATTMQQTMDMTAPPAAPGMGQDPGAQGMQDPSMGGGDPAAAGGDPNAAAAGGAPAGQEAAPPPAQGGVQAKAAMDYGMLAGGITGAALGAGATYRESKLDPRKQQKKIRELEQRQKGGQGGFGTSLSLAKERLRQGLQDVARNNPVKATLAGGVIGGIQGASAVPLVKDIAQEVRDFNKKPNLKDLVPQ